MKKICMIIFSVTLFASFAACSQAKKDADTVKEAVESVVVPEVTEAIAEEVTPEVKPDEAIKAFKAFAKEYGDALNNIKKDPAKFMKLANQVNEKVAAMERIKSTFSKKQLADYEAARDLINQVNTAGKK